MAATAALESLVHGQLAHLSVPLSDDHLRSLALVVGPTMLVDALDLVDKDQVARITPPSGRPIYQVASSSGGPPYTLFPNLDGGGHCPCPAFSYGVVAQGNQVICKHLLACRLADVLADHGGWKDKRVSLKWVAGLATRFGTAVPSAAGE
ncbi:uncharacterized protein JCM10292_001355 [Rhodotorula paludigena]|uniref:uncharacterized protein n=1 Tax=Rhodotorula paludigena TaxID=86838 RepID=UPI0031783C7B